MKKPRLIAALIYATAAICLFEYVDFLSGMEQPRNRLRYPLMAGIALFATACMLSFFRMRWATICALLGATLAWPLLSGPLLTIFGGKFIWGLAYHPDVPAAVVSLLVASPFAVFQLRSFRQPSGDSGGRDAKWALLAAVIFAIGTVTAANWTSTWDLFFRLRYGR